MCTMFYLELSVKINHISRTASTDPALLRSAWTYQQSRRCKNLAGISGKKNWHEFGKSIAESINRIPPRSENYQRFCKLVITKAKKYIPRGVRKSYIPCWTNESEALFKQYKENGDPDTGKKLKTSLKEGRCERCSEEMAALDFTHSSIRAWSLLRKLGEATHSKRQQPKVTANEVAHQLLLNGSVKKDRKQA